jgi:hypothetical protein
VKKIAQNVDARSIFDQKFMCILNCGREFPKISATFVTYVNKKLPKANNRPSPNLVKLVLKLGNI